MKLNHVTDITLKKKKTEYVYIVDLCEEICFVVLFILIGLFPSLT